MRHRINIFTPLGLCLFFSVKVFFAQSSNKMIEKADEYRMNGNYRTARSIYEDILKYEPDLTKANYGLGICLMHTSGKSKAHIYLNKAKLADKNLPEIDFLIALSYQYAHMYAHAKDAFVALLAATNEKKNPERYRFYQKKIQECKNGIALMAQPVSAVITNIGAPINTKYKEYSPALTRDESKIIFTSRRPGSVGNKQDETGEFMEDIYISDFVNGSWTEPRNLGKAANTEGHDASISFSHDGSMIFIYRDDNGGDIYYSDYINQEWSEAKPFSKKVNTKHNESSISMSADGKTVFFSSDKPGGFGGKDLYILTMDAQGKWKDPANLGSTINTEFDEDAPFIHSDGRTLYFSSKGHNTMGGYDIFKSEWTGTQWTEPENLGFPINSGDDDIYFMISSDNKRGYYASFKEGGQGESDIYVISMPEKTPMPVWHSPLTLEFPITIPRIPEKTISPAPILTPFAFLSGKVFDEATKEPLAAKITLFDITHGTLIKQLQASADGTYYIPLLSGNMYGLRVEYDGYLFYSDNFDMPLSYEYQLLLRDVYLQKIKIGTKTVLRNLFFETNSSTIKSESEIELNKLYDLLVENPKLKVEISGHTDDVGSEEYNKKLSLARAKNVVDYLIRRGISGDRLKYKGFGKEKPVAHNTDESGRKLNRRTEFEIIGN